MPIVASAIQHLYMYLLTCLEHVEHYEGKRKRRVKEGKRKKITTASMAWKIKLYQFLQLRRMYLFSPNGFEIKVNLQPLRLREIEPVEPLQL